MSQFSQIIDISGHVIAHKVPTVPRIGIDFDKLDDLNISPGQLAQLEEGEYYTPNEAHLRYAEDNMELDEDTFEFLSNRRIEINAVKNKTMKYYLDCFLNFLQNLIKELD